MVQRFMEKEGLVIGEGEQRRAYIVTTDPPAEYAWIHDQWPLLTQLDTEPNGDNGHSM